ncbi:hypothetical protein NQ318_008593 [Aromia moschata]|uniref:Uncharacterized protein n=1 Tax=Aromia moschata TaxID=1265417 RepID=A0AAV8YVQ4_9CUCU|nr:hypothetical protein NQ318_008593 [Aromia moschata]
MSIDGQRNKILQTLRGHTSDVTSCDFAPNFTLVTGSIERSNTKRINSEWFENGEISSWFEDRTARGYFVTHA